MYKYLFFDKISTMIKIILDLKNSDVNTNT